MSSKHPEFSDTPNGDAAEEFLRESSTQKDPETQRNERMREAVIGLFNFSAMIELQARNIHYSKVVVKEGVVYKTSDNGAYRIGLSERVSSRSFRLNTYTPFELDNAVFELNDTARTEGMIEGRWVEGISLYHSSSGINIGTRNGFTGSHYVLGLETRMISSGPEIGVIIDYSYVLGEEGKYLKQRAINDQRPSRVTYSTDVTPTELETIGAWINALRQRLASFEEKLPTST
ncbi:MAG: hypothetical protein G01um10145_28 [Microgenomates group bacterium Gr01-1014_5]|nr:MAG: hypothetical protein G01um10145_28 [Microgenomates group bacterium Gr01-1014_5]